MKRGDRVRLKATGETGVLLTSQKSKWNAGVLCLVQMDGNDLPVNPVVRWAEQLELVKHPSRGKL